MNPRSRLVIVVRADPVICGHSGEARHLAEAARRRGVDEVRIVTWPLEALTHLPLKPMGSVLPYGDGIVVERPAPSGDYKVPDGRFTAGLVGRLVELFTDGVPTTALSLYLHPHAFVVQEALGVARAMGRGQAVRTIAEAVGSDITNVVRSAVEEDRFGAAAHLFATYLANDHCVAVSDYTRRLIIDAAEQVDRALGTEFGRECRRRVAVSYPAVDSESFLTLDRRTGDAHLARRGLRRDGYVLFLSRVTPAKGVDDLIEGFERAGLPPSLRLVIAGTGAALEEMRARARSGPMADRIDFLDDVGDDEKPHLMAGCAAYVLPSKPKPEFVETFGIALVEKMLAGGGPLITTATGGIPEAVGDLAVVVDPDAPDQVAVALHRVVFELDDATRRDLADRARAHARRFDRMAVFDALTAPVASPTPVPA